MDKPRPGPIRRGPDLEHDVKERRVDLMFSRFLRPLRHPVILALAFWQVCAGLLEVGTVLFGAFMLSLRAPPEVMGIVVGSGWGMGMLGSLLGGQQADRRGTRAVILSGAGATALGLVVEALSFHWLPAALGFLLIQLAQAGLYPAVLRLIEEAAGKQAGNAIGFLDTTYSLVAIGGALLAGWLAQEFGWPFLFLAKAGLYLPPLLLLVLLLPRHRPAPVQRTQTALGGLLTPLRHATLRYIYAAVAAVTVLGYAPSFLAYDPRLAGNPFLLARFPAIYNAAWLLSAWPAGILGDRLGRQKVVVAGYILMGLAWLLFPCPQEIGLLYALYALYCLGNSAGSYATLLAMEAVPPEERGRTVGWSNAWMFGGSTVGESCGGILWGRLGASFSYLLAALGAGLGTLFLLARGRSCRSTPSAPPAPHPPAPPNADGRR